MQRNKKFKVELEDVSDATCDKEEKLIRLLQLGCEHFGLMLGLISEINEGKYHVLSAYPDGLVNTGEVFDLKETICEVTHTNPTITSFTKASGTDWMLHPAYDKFTIESYIGTNYYVDGKPVGTVNFSSLTALGKDFTKADLQNMQLLSHKLSQILQS